MKEKFLLILFYSASGSVRNLAHAIADGAEEYDLKVKLRTVPKISKDNKSINHDIPDSGEIYCTKEDLINCNGLAIGSPTRFGSMAAPLKYFLDSTGDIWSTNALENKPGIAFTSTGSMHGGQEITLFNIHTYMLHQVMVIFGTPYSIDELNKTKAGGTPYGASHVSGIYDQHEITKDEYSLCIAMGKRLAKHAKVLETIRLSKEESLITSS